MQVKIGDLKNNLSRYLRQITASGETLDIVDRKRPVARLSPWKNRVSAKVDNWAKERAQLMAKAESLGFTIRLPENQPMALGSLSIQTFHLGSEPESENSVVKMRREKDY